MQIVSTRGCRGTHCELTVTFAAIRIVNRINSIGSRSAPCGTPATIRSHATVSPGGIKLECTTVPSLFYCAACIAGDSHVALIRVAQSVVVCPTFCNVTLGLAMPCLTQRMKLYLLFYRSIDAFNCV